MTTSTTEMRFVDTNVLLYAISTARDESRKARMAREILESTDLALSIQVLQEFYVQATRSSRTRRLSHDQAATLVESFLRFPVQQTSVAIMRAAMATRDRFGLSYWDAAILEAARALHCQTVLSEDLQHGGDYAGVRVVDPFR